MNSKKRTLAVCLSLSSLLLAGCGGSGSDSGEAAQTDGEAAEIESITLRVTTPIGGAEHFNNTPISTYLEAVKEASGGKIDYEFYYGDALVAPTEIGQALRDGTVDMAGYVSSYTPAEHPVDTWLASQAFQGDVGAPGEAMQVSAATVEWWNTHPEVLQSDWLDNGIVPFLPGATPLPSYNFICSSPVESQDDAAGKLIRTPGEAWANTVTHFDMEPVSLPGAEMYEALQRGVVDCVTNGAPSFMNPPLREVAKEHTTVGLPGIINWGLFMSKATWDDLPEKSKEILWSQLPAYLDKDITNAIEMNTAFVKEAEEFDVTFHELDADFKRELDAYQADVLANAPANAPEGVQNPEKLVQDYSELHDKWASMLEEDLNIPTGGSWQEWVEAGNSPDSVDVSSFSERVWSEFLKDSRPE